MGLIYLKELRLRYWQAIGYYHPSEKELISKQANRDPYPRRLDNELGYRMDVEFTKAAFGGKLRFHGAPEIGSKHVLGGGQSLLPSQDIPVHYFALSRGFYENKITSYSDLQDANIWHETLHANPRHPDYVNVLVYDTDVEDFMSSLEHFAANLLGVTAAKPHVTELTLCEALTFLAFGLAISKSEIAEHLDPTFQRRYELISKLNTQAEFTHLTKLKAIDCFAVVEHLRAEKTPQPWPLELQELHRLAIEGSEKSWASGLLLAKSTAAFIQAARDGKFICVGNEARKSGTCEVPISVFRQPLFVNWLFDSLGPSDIFDPNDVEEYVNLTIPASAYFNWVASLGQNQVYVDKQSTLRSIKELEKSTTNSVVKTHNRPPNQRYKAEMFLKSIDTARWSDTLEALTTEMQATTGVAVSKDTMRRAVRVLTN